MAALCARLKERGYVLALASSKPEKMCVPICDKFGFTPPHWTRWWAARPPATGRRPM